MVAETSDSAPTRLPQPLILVRGFGGLDVEDERRIAYQGFNDGTVYPQKRGENYIYEGLILRFLKSSWQYHDATNVVGYYGSPVRDKPLDLPAELAGMPEDFFSGDKVIIDPAMAKQLLRPEAEVLRTLWVFRYYDLNDRDFPVYGAALVKLIDLIREIARRRTGSTPKVNVLAHSMGGLLVRHAVQCTYPDKGRRADEHINKIVTLGTPHQGISFQFLQSWLRGIEAGAELEAFNPGKQQDPGNPAGVRHFAEHFPLDRLLTVVGTNYRSYEVGIASRLNRLASVAGEFGPNYNRSDGLVKQSLAQVPGAPRTFVHKCHGGFDSLVTARESYEIATRFFFGDLRARLKLVRARITRGKDLFGKSEFFFGTSIKPRRVDFDLFHQSAEAENCYGPFQSEDLSDPEVAFPWAGADRLIWEGNLDVSRILKDDSVSPKDLVMRLDVYVGERDLFGLGFSDNVIFRAQHYVRVLLQAPFTFYHYTDERFARPGHQATAADEMRQRDGGWEFTVEGDGFQATFRVELDTVPEVGEPRPFGGPV